MSETNIKSIPYGVTDYEAIRTDNSYYVDKTSYLDKIEKAGKYLFFIRPRRFGKSLFLSVMETYYDISKADRFDLFYQGTHIHQHPTKEKNKYLVLKFNFSAVDPYANRLENSFLNQIQAKTRTFLVKYNDYLNSHNRELLISKIENLKSAADILLNVVELCGESNQKIYIIIDEYDNFANTILSTSGSQAYKDLTHGEGFFRAFFNFLKEGTTGSGALISRLFITGVSPVTLDDVTSGFNIGKNISIDVDFNEMLGFTKEDVIEMIDYYNQKGIIKYDSEYLLDIMTTWYNNYIFSKKSTTKLFNSDMILYFLDECTRNQDIPDELIDQNVRIDYGKLRHLIIIDKDKDKFTNGNFTRLQQIIEKGEIVSDIAKGFPLEKLIDTRNFLSLLFYLGLLTVKEVKDEEPILKIPNETARRLYYDYIKEAYEETDAFSLDWYRYGRLMHRLAYQGEWKPLFDYLGQQMKDRMSLRDLITGEKSIQAFLNVYLGLSQLYIIHAEKELNKGFADPVKPGVVKVVMEPFTARYREMKYAYILELKYLKKDEKKKLPSTIKKAENQLKKYTLDDKFKKSFANTTLIKLVLVFYGTQLEHIGEVGH
jgi:hypothetical protein